MIEHKPRTGGRKKRPTPAEPLDPLQASVAQYLEWIAAHGFSEDTVNTRRAYLGYFHEWCQERGLSEPIEITRPILERYQRWLYHYRKTNGQPHSVSAHNADTSEHCERRQRFLFELLTGVPIQPVTVPIALHAGQIDGHSHAKGMRIPLSDLLIGASALELGCGVGIANVRHFQLIPGLTSSSSEAAALSLLTLLSTAVLTVKRVRFAAPQTGKPLTAPGRCRQPILRREKKGGFCSGVPPCRSRATGFSENRS